MINDTLAVAHQPKLKTDAELVLDEFKSDLGGMAQEILKLRKLTDEMGGIIEKFALKKKKKRHKPKRGNAS